MVNNEKPTFSNKELKYLTDTDFLLTKQIINQKIEDILVACEEKLKTFIHNSAFHFPAGTLKKAGKISKGESYQLLPYQVLDFPRLLKKQNIFAYRTMCWWGHFFSYTLHLQGEALETYRPILLKNLIACNDSDLYVCINSTPWEYHYKANNYKRWSDFEAEEKENLIENHPFLKISKKIAIDEYKDVENKCLTNFKYFLNILTKQAF